MKEIVSSSPVETIVLSSLPPDEDITAIHQPIGKCQFQVELRNGHCAARTEVLMIEYFLPSGILEARCHPA